MMMTLIFNELIKIFSKWRTYISYLALGAIILLIQTIVFFDGSLYVEAFDRNISDNFIMTGNIVNGYLIAYFIMQALYIHIPFLIVLVGGDIMASEATAGTFRLLLIRPVTRIQVVLSKFIAGSIYVLSVIFFLFLFSLLLSLLFFGTGDLMIWGMPVLVIAKNDIFWRFLCAYLFASLSLLTVFSLSFLFSSLVENAVGPIIATMAVIIVFMVLSNINVEFVENIKPYLFTTYSGDWSYFFKDTLDFQAIFRSASVLLLHISGFLLFSSILFYRKDILS